MSDLGQEFVDSLYERMKIDDEWSVREPRGFTWWPGLLKQRIWVEDPFEDEDMEIWRAHVRSDFIEGFGDTEDERWAMTLGEHSSLAGFVRCPEDHTRVQFASSAYFHEETLPFICGLMGWVAPIQAIDANELCDPVADLFDGWAPDSSAHPTSGVRDDPDELLGLVELLVEPEGRCPSVYAGADMKEALEGLPEPPHIFPSGDDSSVATCLPFPGCNTLLSASTTKPHLGMGNGLSISLKIPHNCDGKLPADALAFNELELSSLTRSHFLGSWSVSDSGDMTFSSFIPNSLFVDGITEHMLMSHTMRAGWIAQDLADHSWADNYENDLARSLEVRKMWLAENGVDVDKLMARATRKPGFFARLFGRGK